MFAVITGASSGIGKELAYRFAKKEYDLILIARREDRLTEIKNNLEKLNVKVEILKYNLSNLESCINLISNLETKEIEIFVNNAGFGVYGHSITNDTDKEFNMIDLNIKTLHFLTKEIIKIMNKGTIINVSSMAAFLPTPLLASYAATKAYVYSYSEALRYELLKKEIPINVMTVCPGPVKTEFNEVANANPKMKGLTVEKCVDYIIKGLDKKRSLVIPGFKMKLLKFLLRFIPNWLLLRMSYKIQSKK
ncbi:MAG: SDR family oxidoreductase [Candidatus Izemoplasmatales bacterium]|nr:SDR family oxidoreductase [Candidatus Izemoplasmatales bacterium]